MGKATVKVEAGICGFVTEIEAVSEDGQNARVLIETGCPSLKPAAQAMEELDGFAACFGKPCDSSVYQTINKYCAHAACPVPVAIIKAVEVACGFALPKDAHIAVSKDE